MNTEQIFWTNFWKIMAAVVISLIVTTGGCTAHQSKLVADAIDNGAHPIEARCGIVSSAMSECAIRAAK